MVLIILRLSSLIPAFVAAHQIHRRKSAPTAQSRACHLLSLLSPHAPLSVASGEHRRYPRRSGCADKFLLEGASFSSHLSKSRCRPLSSSLIKTLAEMCIALTRQSPSLISLSATIFETCDVILINARLVCVLNVRYAVLDLILAACRYYRLQQVLYLCRFSFCQVCYRTRSQG